MFDLPPCGSQKAFATLEHFYDFSQMCDLPQRGSQKHVRDNQVFLGFLSNVRAVTSLKCTISHNAVCDNPAFLSCALVLVFAGI